MIVSVIAAILAVVAFLLLRQLIQDARLARLDERDQRLVQIFEQRLLSRIEAIRLRIAGAELLVAATPPSARIAAKALSYAMNEEGNESYAAAVVLDERGGVLASRRRGSVPPAGEAEKRVWRRAAQALRLQERKRDTANKRYHLEAGTLKGIPVIFVAAPSTKGFWGVILPAEALLPVEAGELGPGGSAFLLTEPDQSVLFARQREKFFFDAIGKSFERSLSGLLGIGVCCDPASFNTVNEGQRWMAQRNFPGGTKELRLVRVADRRRTEGALASTLRYLGGGIFLGWVILVGAFAALSSRRVPREHGMEAEPEEMRPASGDGAPVHSTSLAALSRVSDSVARGDHFRDVITSATREGARLIRADRFYAALYDDGMDQLFEVCSSRVGEEYRAAIAMGTGDLPERIAMREKDIVEVTSLEDWEEAPEAMKVEGVKATAVFPLRAGDRILGLMSFYFDSPHELPSEEVDACSFLALQGAVAVARALCLPEPPAEG